MAVELSKALLFLVALIQCAPAAVAQEKMLIPAIDGDWTQIAGNPDLGDLTGPNQQPVDFAVWQAADGTWQAWSCIRKTKCGGHTRLFYRWEGQNLTDPDWKPMGIAMRADPTLGEDEGGLQAPHVIKRGDKYHMFYGDWNNICHSVSDDGKNFERVIQPSGKAAMFTEGPGNNTRDVVMLKVGDIWHAYYTAFPNRQGAVFMRTTTDFREWSESTVVAFGGSAGTDPFSAECPHVIARHGRYYLFRTQEYGPENVSTVYHSADPGMFGINQDERYLATRLEVAAPEIVHYEGEDYIVALNLNLDGLRIAKLKWRAPPEIGEAVFDLDTNNEDRWQIESGDLAGILTNSKRSDFNPPQRYFIGTAESGDGQLDDSRSGVIRSPEFTITKPEYFAFVSGGTDSSLYVAVIDAETGEELLRITNAANSNTLRPQLLQTKEFVGRKAFLRIVDKATGGWGHINFGGLYAAS